MRMTSWASNSSPGRMVSCASAAAFAVCAIKAERLALRLLSYPATSSNGASRSSDGDGDQFALFNRESSHRTTVSGRSLLPINGRSIASHTHHLGHPDTYNGPGHDPRFQRKDRE
jgi:hypothetical protein